MVRLSYLALVSASSSDAISWLRPRVHDAASTTIGILPPSLHRSMASAMEFGHELVALAIALRLPRSGATESGDVGRDPQRLSARSDSVTNASGKDGESRAVRIAAKHPVDAGWKVDGCGTVLFGRPRSPSCSRHRTRHTGYQIGIRDCARNPGQSRQRLDSE